MRPDRVNPVEVEAVHSAAAVLEGDPEEAVQVAVAVMVEEAAAAGEVDVLIDASMMLFSVD